MALRRNSFRKQSTGSSATRKPEGTVRRTQLITTYGVGSLVAIDDRSFIVGGIDTWDVSRAPRIHEPNLQHWLGVGKFVLPPADPEAGDGVRVRLFPQMYSCPECKTLQKFSKFGSPSGKSECGSCRKPLTPSRFVLACPNGHLDDFPYWEWVHHKTRPVSDSADKTHELSLTTEGNSASLRSIIVSCSCGAERVSMQGAFGPAAMKDLNVRCGGHKPWLGKDTVGEDCSEIPRTLQRGSSAAWFPIQRSSLSIPPWSSKIQKLVDRYSDQLGQFTDQSRRDAVVSTMAVGSGFSPDQISAAIEERQNFSDEERDEDEAILDAATRLRRKEYLQLKHGTSGEDHEDFECEPSQATTGDPAPHGLEKIMLVKRLREVRALQSFTRVDVPDPARPSARRAPLSKETVNWLPAIEVNGEGVFITLDIDRLQTWETGAGPRHRATQIRSNHTELLRDQSPEAAANRIESPVSPRFILLHTLAHALINEWSLDCGYPSASLRERLYCSDDMSGILIYTASSDSAGSLGGVVAQGEVDRLRSSLASAMERIAWCSQDPPCMESEASGTDNLNLAACYACVLLPETSCETNNAFLDRGLLVGTPTSSEIGYFSGYLG